MPNEYELIASSHEDFDTWVTIEAGIDSFKRLVVKMTHHGLNGKQRTTSAVVDTDETITLARTLDTDIYGVVGIISENYADESPFTPSETEAIFKDILEKLLDTGVKFRLKR